MWGPQNHAISISPKVVYFEGLDAVVVPERSLFSFSSEVDSPSPPPSLSSMAENFGVVVVVATSKVGGREERIFQREEGAFLAMPTKLSISKHGIVAKLLSSVTVHPWEQTATSVTIIHN